tara:strand:- start:2172 stop:3626 length:1455 start_codon:yes stop_codon:yes gene_type:complete
MMMMKTKVENMSEERQLKAELERYFTAVVDEQYQKQYPDVTSPIGTPLFYDEYGEIDADYISEMTGMSENGVKTSFDAWKSSGNVPPTEKPVAESRSARPSPLSRPKLNQVPVPERRESTSLLGGIKDDLNDVLEMRRLEHELDNVGAAGYNNYPSATHQNDLTAVITALAPLLKQDRPSIDPMTMTLMKQLNDRTQDSTAQMIALFNMNQQSNQQWMTMLMENMRGNGGRSSLEDRLLNHSLDKMLTGGDTPEDSIFSELVKSGQLGEIVQGAAAGIAGIANRRVPMGENPYQGQEALPEPQYVEPEPELAQELAPTFEPPVQARSAMTYQEKCTYIMEEMRPSLSDEWKSDGNTMNMLMNVIEIAVKRGEDYFPGDEASQVALAAKETMMIANLRTVGTSLNKIEKGEIGIELAATVLTNHPLWQVFQNETYESLLSAVNAYAEADLEDSKSITFDLEYLNRPTTRPIIESLLAQAKGGGAQ